ncbi:hypothetical protein V2J09_007498 [Rumex salicifolius]
MAGTLFRLTSAVIFATLISFAFHASGFTSFADVSGQNKAGASGPLILPLSHSISSRNLLPRRAYSHSYRRHLEKAGVRNASNARMPLFDDLLRHGYYTTRLYIGTPPQEFALIVDTGSTVTYVPCSTCESCGKHQDPRFQPEMSSTYEPVKCNIDCTCDEEEKQCVYDRRYAEMSSSSGVVAEDVVSFGNESQLVPQRVAFGCENVETGDLFSQRADGIMGLGRGTLSIMDQLVDKGAINDSFSLCYGGMDIGGGAMILGTLSSPNGMIFTRSDPSRSPYYNIELKDIHVAGKPLKLNPKVFDGKHGTVLDSGTTYAYLPEAAFSAFKAAVFQNTSLKHIPGPDPNYGDICFAGAGRDASLLSKSFPSVHMEFSNGEKLQLSPENYLFRHTKVPGAYCLGIFQNGNDQTTLLGGIVVRNTLVTYDRGNEKVGFWKTNCSELWKGQYRTPAPAPSPSNSQTQNDNSELPPMQAPASASAPAPGDSEVDDLSGEFRVGQITFDMLLPGVNSTSMPNLTQLGDFIAEKFDINPSQVHMLNFTSEGNHSIVRWVIYPESSSNYISDREAKSIIVRLSEHHMQFPGLGNYEVVGWKVHPQTDGKQSHHSLAAVIVGFAILIIAFTSIGVFFIWMRHRQTANLYEPVGLASPDRELQLQPL